MKCKFDFVLQRSGRNCMVQARVQVRVVPSNTFINMGQWNQNGTCMWYKRCSPKKSPGRQDHYMLGSLISSSLTMQLWGFSGLLPTVKEIGKVSKPKSFSQVPLFLLKTYIMLFKEREMTSWSEKGKVTSLWW